MTLASLPFWRSGEYLHRQLNINMRAREDEPYSRFCQQVGDGTLPSAASSNPADVLAQATVNLPSCICCEPDTSYSDLLGWVYEGWDKLELAQMSQFYEHRSVLAPTNTAADEMNAYMYCVAYLGGLFIQSSRIFRPVSASMSELRAARSNFL